MRILVTDGAGSIGSAFIRQITRNTNTAKNAGYLWVFECSDNSGRGSGLQGCCKVR
jgi:FlaA1/EpsC-like NDP-sugar epimerase